jgi:hypothetical protein
MDEDRRIRFLVAPLLFIASLGWGMWLDQSWREAIKSLPSPDSAEKGIGQAIAILAGGGIVVFAIGLVIGTVSYVALRFLSLLIRHVILRRKGVNTHELGVSDETLRLIWAKIGAPGEVARSQDFFAAVEFDHGMLRETNPGVHHWMVRRWNAFSISVTSFTGLVLSLVVGHIACVHLSAWWIIPAALMLVLFFFNAVFSWWDTMRMLAFQATLPIDTDKKNESQSGIFQASSPD